MKPIVISDVSTAKYQYLLTSLRAHKEILVKDNTIAFHGVELQSSYANNSLTLTVIKKPFDVTLGHIKEVVEEQLAEYVAPVPGSAHLYPNNLPTDMTGFAKKEPDWMTALREKKS
jgi:hypothetical protein